VPSALAKFPTTPATTKLISSALDAGLSDEELRQAFGEIADLAGDAVAGGSSRPTAASGRLDPVHWLTDLRRANPKYVRRSGFVPRHVRFAGRTHYPRKEIDRPVDELKRRAS
jgi:hypothetical protein